MKNGLDYFPVDIDFFDDEKIQFVSARFGIKGELITIKLLARVYRNGYYLKWDEDISLLIAKKCGDGINGTLINDVVIELVKRGFFNKDIFNSFGVITSNGIQKRFFDAVKRRKIVSVIEEYLVPEFKSIHDVNILRENVNISYENDNINAQSRVEKSKEKESTAHAERTLSESNLFRKPAIPAFQEVEKVFLQQGGTKEMAKKFFETNESTGWFYRGSPIKNFVSLVPGYISSWQKNVNSKTSIPDKSLPAKNINDLLNKYK